MTCLIDDEVTFENIKANIIAGGASEEDAEHDSKVATDFIRRSCERDGEYDNKQIPPGFTIISHKPGEVSEEQKQALFNVLDSTIDTFLAAKKKRRDEGNK